LNATETLSPVLPNELEADLHRLLSKASEREIMLATAESCTGGMLASLLTDIPGIAHCFERGFVTYTDESKNELLGVPKDLLKDKGAVSQEVAIAMAEGALERSRANMALAVTGFADTGDEPGWFTSPAPGRPPHHPPEEHFGAIGRGRCGSNACAWRRDDDGDAVMALMIGNEAAAGLPFENIHRHGFVRTAAATPLASAGNIAFNVDQTLELARQGHKQGVDLIVYPELNISSYSVDDLHLQEAFLDAVELGIARLCEQSAELNPVLAVGAPIRRNGRLYNCALAIHRGRILGVVPKSFLPNYREYYEKRWFAPGIGTEGLSVVSPASTCRSAPTSSSRRRTCPTSSSTWRFARIIGRRSRLPPTARSPAPDPVQPVRLQHHHRQGRRAQIAVRRAGEPLPRRLHLRRLGPGESTTDLAWDGQGSVYELGELLAENSRFAREAELAVADVDVQKLRLERLRTGTFNDNAIRRRPPGETLPPHRLRACPRRPATSASRACCAAFPMCRTAPSSSTRIATRRSTSRCRASPPASRRPAAST
jgi:predicted amidohydrolase